MQRISRWRVVFFAVIIFTGGALVGASGFHFYQGYHRQQNMEKRAGKRTPRSAAEHSERFAAELDRRYRLTPEKKSMIAAAFKDFLTQMSRLRDEFFARMREEHEKMDKSLQTFLSPEDYADWQKEKVRRFPNNRFPGSRKGVRGAPPSPPNEGKPQPPVNETGKMRAAE